MFVEIQKQLAEVFHKKSVCKCFAKFAGNNLYRSLFFNKLANLGYNLIFKKRLQHKCLPMNLTKFVTIPIQKNTNGRLLLEISLVQSPACYFLEFSIKIFLKYEFSLPSEFQRT